MVTLGRPMRHDRRTRTAHIDQNASIKVVLFLFDAPGLTSPADRSVTCQLDVLPDHILTKTYGRASHKNKQINSKHNEWIWVTRASSRWAAPLSRSCDRKAPHHSVHPR